MSDLEIVVVENDPFIAEDIAATLVGRFPHSALHAFPTFDEARPAMSQSDASVLVVAALRTATVLCPDVISSIEMSGAAVVLIDATTSNSGEIPSSWKRIEKPFTQEMLLATAQAALCERQPLGA